MTSRRAFLGGALSFGTLVGCRAFRVASGSFGGAGARLRLALLSDIHVDTLAGDFGKFGDVGLFRTALEWYAARHVDAVVVTGDLADNGMRAQLNAVGEAWRSVFPDNRDGDGRPVKPLFIYGNHDLDGWAYDGYAQRFNGNGAAFRAAQIAADPAGAWREAFGEEYAPIWHRQVKGYDFVGANWPLPFGGAAVADWFAAHGSELKAGQPFFYLQHPHPGSTVFAGRPWGDDGDVALRALRGFPNAVALSGHAHCSLGDETAIWQGEFTAVGLPSLRWLYQGWRGVYDRRQGALMTVYDDRLVIERHDFGRDCQLGPDWVVPLPLGASRPYDFETRKAAVTPPNFATGARLAVAATEEGWELTIPPAAAAKAFRVRTGVISGGREITIERIAADYGLPRAQADGEPTPLTVERKSLPEGAEPRFSVEPLDEFGNAGFALTV